MIPLIYTLCCAFLVGQFADSVAGKSQPNIILIVADDLGWNDVGWHNKDIETPNLDTLAHEGVILNYSYVHSICSPSRAALLTGYYPFRMGMQHGALKRDKPHGLPIDFTLLPEKLQKLGYSTHMIGKWHLGFCRWEYTPTFRGFDTFFGFYTGSGDYYKHICGQRKVRGYDYRLNTKVYRPRKKKYSTIDFSQRAVDLIMHHYTEDPLFLYLSFQSVHAPLQVPKRYLYKYGHVKNKYRRMASAMITAMDDAVGTIIPALMQKGIYDNTLIVFLSDNGAAVHNGGSNWPLRGAKGSNLEGGTRVPSFVWGRMLNTTRYVNNELIHAVDWTPTLLAAAGGKTNLWLDGINQWNTISYNKPSARKSIVYDLNERTGRAAIRVGKYKLLQGFLGLKKDWYPASPQSTYQITKLRRDRYRFPNRSWGHRNETHLFDLQADPVERFNLAWKFPEVVKDLSDILDDYRSWAVPAFYPPRVKKSNPKYWNGVWSPGWC